MKLRHAWLPALALACCGFASDQQVSSSKQDGSPAPAQTASGRKLPHIRFGGFFVNAGYSNFGRWPGWGWYPGYWGYWPYYDPFFASAFAPGYYTGFAYQPWMGEVKLQSPSHTAWVYLDGALAGRADKLRHMWLDPGVYTVELRDGGRSVSQKIYVLTGKKLELSAAAMQPATGGQQ